MIKFLDYASTAANPFNPATIVSACIEAGYDALLLDSKYLPKEFFDLSTGVTGALVHRLSVYGIKMAVVIPDTSLYSRSFQDFVREANKGNQFRFTPTREEALSWLEGV